MEADMRVDYKEVMFVMVWVYFELFVAAFEEMLVFGRWQLADSSQARSGFG